MAWFATGAMAVVSAYGAMESAKAGNKAASASQANSARRYAIQAGVAEDQMDEQNQIAVEKMTDVTRQFLVAKGRATAIQAEAGVTGATSQRQQSVMRTKASEAKGQIAKEINTNIINIAQDMIATKIDSEAMISEAESRKKNVFTETAMGAIQGGMQGYSMGVSMGAGAGVKSTGPKTGAANGTTSFDSLNGLDMNKAMGRY